MQTQPQDALKKLHKMSDNMVCLMYMESADVTYTFDFTKKTL